jgi:hypothetical protein
MKFDHSEFQFYQAKFHLRIEKIICWFYRVERNIYSRFFTWVTVWAWDSQIQSLQESLKEALLSFIFILLNRWLSHKAINKKYKNVKALFKITFA